MRNINSPLLTGEEELFRRDILQVVVGPLGNLIVNTAPSPAAKTYVGTNNEVYIDDSNIKVTVFTSGLTSFIMYQELNKPPIFISNGIVYEPKPVNS